MFSFWSKFFVQNFQLLMKSCNRNLLQTFLTFFELNIIKVKQYLYIFK